MATVQTGLMTADEFWDWCCRPENAGKRAELVRGEIVEMPSPGFAHGLLCSWIAHLLWLYVGRRGIGGVTSNDTGLVVAATTPATVRGPDVMLFGECDDLRKATRRHARDVPELIVEVLSPHDSWTDMLRRVQQYHALGVALVWVVDGDARTVTVCRPKEYQQLLEETEELTGNGVLADFHLPVAQIFSPHGAKRTA
jgi:Uma2 family endonuclease